jgi:rRNA-processing protein FCF1
MLECNSNYGNDSRSDLRKVCEAALSASRNVIFAALVNTNGILIVGKYRCDHLSKLSKLSSEKVNTDVSKSCVFYLERLLPYLMGARKANNNNKNSGNLTKKDGERIELDLLNVDGKIKTAITRIPELPNMFLCVEYISS